MSLNFKKLWNGLTVKPKASTTSDSAGDIEYLSSDNKLRLHNGTSNSPIVTEAHTQTLTNKVIDADANTITNIENADIKSGAAIARDKLASGSAYRVAANDASGVLSDAAAITAARALVSDANGIPTHSVTTTTELSYVSGVTSAIQTQINSKTAQTDFDAHLNDTTDAHDASAISNIPSGNLAATDAQSALNELQSDIDTRALNSDLNTHMSDTTTHGTAGDIVGTSDTQTLSNKTFGDAITATQISTPSNPASGKDKIYFKSDDKLYKLTSGGLESEIGRSGIVENAQTGTTYTFVLSDQDKLVSLSNASPVTATVPTNASVAFPIGTTIQVISGGAGVVEFSPAGGVTIQSLHSYTRLEGQYAAATLVKTATNTWYFYGELTDAAFIVATGGTITTIGDYKFHTFTSSGTFQILAGNDEVQSLVVPGGGGGGFNQGGGGGGGFPVFTSPGATIGAGSYTVTIGAGGAGATLGTAANAPSTRNGSSSVFDTVTATGGGGGGSGSYGAGAAGSDGGGGSYTDGAGGAGSPGFAGGSGANAPNYTGGGGGGGGAVGQNGSSSGNSGAGGIGAAYQLTAAGIATGGSTYYGGGGGAGAGYLGLSTAGAGGNGGGGAGSTGGIGADGTVNTGGGGGGGSGAGAAFAGGAGGSGIVIVSYKFQ